MISSLQNPRVKQLVKLREKSSERQKQGLFIIEGHGEIALACEAGVVFREIFYCAEIADPALLTRFDPHLLQEVTLPVFEKIAYREHSGGIIGLAEYHPLGLRELRLSANPFLIILEAVEKPGNLGAILRTADAAKADAVIICDPKTDLGNPNVIRSSLGCVFSTQVVAASSDETLDFLKEKKIKSYAAALTAVNYYHETDLTAACAIVMGTESTGLTEKWLREADDQIKIPMRGRIDSLNVSTSCAIIVFEAMRQRGF
ncbi:TrmH family RNA methyltransferase [Anseongella ginsenosidimutans]|uniref:TrmH family RNA methyltransferase n=1 Tax=Anseongella ginsenosidimutans TaxID=496056 RepID=A0A4R3KMP1_9SPHI|nr:RNA methyltransferase [Anseongella ginsenosidimutans]QEC52068.1 RNA methyltransferase [Anseongella ginsenosidimutans]TCS85618.1 TrmH family RNA methyltransferase [Anseongella ginsenosidimutans]